LDGNLLLHQYGEKSSKEQLMTWVIPYFSTNAGVKNTPGPTKIRGWKNAGGSRRYVGEKRSERRDMLTLTCGTIVNETNTRLY